MSGDQVMGGEVGVPRTGLPPRALVTAARTADRLAAARSWVRSELARGEVLLVTATPGAGIDFARSLAVVAPVFGLRRSTLAGLAESIAGPELAAAGLGVATRLGRRGLVARALSAVRAEGALGILEELAEAPHLAAVCERTLGDLEAWQVGAAELATVPRRGAVLAALERQLEASGRAHGLVGRSALLRRAAARVAAAETAALPLLLLDVVPRDPAEGALLAAWLTRAPAVLATVDRGDRAGLQRLEEMFGTPALDVTAPPAPARFEGARPDRGCRLYRLQTRLFHAAAGDEASRETPTDAGDTSISWFVAAGEGRECVELVRRVLAHAEAGVPFDRMAVLLRDPALYLDPLLDALARAGVPAWPSRGTVRPDPAGRAFLTLLRCAQEGLTASRFAEYLGFGQLPRGEAAAEGEAAPATPAAAEPPPWVPPRTEEVPTAAAADAADDGQLLLFPVGLPIPPGEAAREAPAPGPAAASGPPVGVPAPSAVTSPRQWERLLVDAAVVGGYERWERRLTGLRNELELRLAEVEGEAARQRLQDQVARLDALRAFALPLVERLARLPGSATWRLWRQQLAELALAALAHPERVLAVLTELAVLDDVGPVSLDEVERVLAEELTELRTEPPAGRAGRLLVATPAEAAGRSFAVVFLPGLAEGIFPRPGREDPLLLDADRTRLSQRLGLAWPLPGQREQAAEERRWLRLAAAAAEHHLVLSYASVDAGLARARVPSFYALDMLRAADGTLPSLSALAPPPPAAGGRFLGGLAAPAEPELAIDEAEYDLAQLAAAFADPAGASGAARYLLEVHPRLGMALRARYARWEQRRFGAADGLVTSRRELLADHQLASRAYSPTALEAFAACPYRFYLQGVLGLREREDAVPLVQLDPLTRGSFFHAVQFRFFNLERERGGLPVGLSALAAAGEVLDRALDEVAAEYADRLAPAIPQVWQAEIEALRIDLRGWLRRTAEAVDAADPATGAGPWVPRHFELSFGLSAAAAGGAAAHDPASRREDVTVLGRVRLRGSIDLVEESADGAVLRVTDHKTGRPPEARVLRIGGGRSLQPILYALAAGVVLGRPVRSGRLFFCTRQGGYAEREVALDPFAVEAIQTVLEAVAASLERAELPAVPAEDACRWCAYRPVCGPGEEARVRFKDGPILTTLRELRERE
jgi:ATP-dependent helicase/nuclease subunit B